MVASFIDDSKLLCVSPTGVSARAGSSLSLDFATASGEYVRTFSLPPGTARISNGLLRLTEADLQQTGSALVSIGALDSMSEFAAEFDVYIGGGPGGEGVSFNVGSLPPTHFGERGVRSALSIQLLSAERRLEVWHANVMLAQSGEPLFLSRGRFSRVEVTYGDEGLGVSVGGLRVVENVTLSRWSPDASWTVGFGARTGETAHDMHLVDNFRLRSGSAFRKRTVPVEVSINSQEHTQDATAFSFYSEPIVSHLRFERGPVSGGTSVAVSGSSFRGGSVYRCRFGPQTVNATYDAYHDELRCVSPAANASGAAVEISLNGQQFTTSGVIFEYYELVSVSHLVPSAGPRQGGTAITVFGAGFSHGRDYRCRFSGGTPAVVMATVEGDGRIACTTPAPRCGSGACREAVEVSLNSESYSSSGVEFTYHNATVLSLDVVSGPSSGGTVITVHGAGFMQMARVETVCRFAHGSVVASFIDDSKLLCVSPPAVVAGVALVRDRRVTTFQRILPSANTFTLPAESSGVLRLVSPSHWRGVEPSISMRDATPNALFADAVAFRDFTVAFYINVTSRAIDGGESISFCAGANVSMHLPARASIDGFCVITTHHNTSHIVLEDRGVALARVGVPPARDRWQRVEITLSEQTVSVSHDGIVVLNRTRLSVWEPPHGFQMSIINRQPTVLLERLRGWLAGVRVVAGSLLRARDAPVEVSLNSQEFTTDNVPFTYLPEPHVHTIFPVAGPVAGGTSVALGVYAPAAFANATELRCRFVAGATGGVNTTNATWDPEAQRVRCTTPPGLAAGQVEATVSMRLDAETLSGGDGVAYTFYPPAVLQRVWPDAGPTSGATDIAIAGSGFGAGIGPFACRIGRTDIVPATVELRSRVVRCVTPARAEGAALVEVTLNGQQYHGEIGAPSALHFGFYSPPHVLSMSPSSGSVLGRTAVTIAGTGFRGAYNHLCRWGNLTTNITELGATQLVCATPQTPTGSSAVEITLNGQQYTSDGLRFSHYLHPRVRHLSVPGEIGSPGTYIAEKITLPQAGFIMVQIWGSGFMGGTDYRCKINAHAPLAATYDARSDAIRCWSDLWVDGNNTVEVTLNGREYTADGVTIPINKFWFDERYNSPAAAFDR